MTTSKVHPVTVIHSVDNITNADLHWHPVRTIFVLTATLSLYFCELLLLIGGGVFGRTIAAGVGDSGSKSSWLALLCTISTVALVPCTSQLSDYVGRKWCLVVPGLFGFVGSIVVARANSFGTVIAGVSIGSVSFASNAIFSTVASEVLPRKYRSWGQAAANVAVALGSIFSLTVCGRLTQDNPEGFRTYFYITAGFYGAGSLACMFAFHGVAPREAEVLLSWQQKLAALDWMGYLLIATGTIFLCLGLSWAQNPYPWTDAHVLGPLILGFLLLVALGIYSWKFKDDGLLHHGLFKHRNLTIALFSVFIEGMAFLASAVYFPYALSVVHGATMGAFEQALCYMIAFPVFIVSAFLAALYIYWTKTVRIPGAFTYLSFLAFFISMATVTENTPERNFWAYISFYGVGLGVCLVTFTTAAQFATAPELISITSGIVLTVRSLGGSIGLAVFNALFSHGLNNNLAGRVSAALDLTDLPPQDLANLVAGLVGGNKTLIASVPNVSASALGRAGLAVEQAYIAGFRNVFICGAVVSALAIISALFLQNPTSQFTQKVDAPIGGNSIEGKADGLQLDEVESHRFERATSPEKQLAVHLDRVDGSTA